MTPWDDMVRLLCKVWSSRGAITTKSDLAREWANEIAEAISHGRLTTEVFPGTSIFSNQIRITREGLRYMEEATVGLSRESLLELLKINVEGPSDQLQGKDRPD